MRFSYRKIVVLIILVLTIGSALGQSTIESISKNMVLVKGGSFVMGCTTEQTDCYASEKPTHKVTVSSFMICKYEVTNAQYASIMGSFPVRFSSMPKGCASCPVDYTDWNVVLDFINKLNAKTGKSYRLPTEAEWEFAARGGLKSKGYKFSGSDDVNKVAWQLDNAKSSTHPVGTLLPNELGLYDMSGNVAEWCSDWYSEDYYSKSVANDPKGPENPPAKLGDYKIDRGGGFNTYSKNCNVSGRGGTHVSGATDGNSGIGFRLVLDVK
jgi:formylglycine-generating enzyme